MKTASEVMVHDWAIHSANILAKYVEESVLKDLVNFDFDSIDANSCEHCGAHILDWEEFTPFILGAGKPVNQVVLKRGPDKCFGRLCGWCEVGTHH